MKRRLRTAGAETHIRHYGANVILNALHDGVVEWDEDGERWVLNPILRTPGAFLLWTLRELEKAHVPFEQERGTRDRPERRPRPAPTTPADRPAAEALWALVLKRLEAETTRANYSTWIAPVTALAVTSERLVLGVPGEAHAEWLELRLVGLIARVVADIHGSTLDIVVEQVQ